MATQQAGTPEKFNVNRTIALALAILIGGGGLGTITLAPQAAPQPVAVPTCDNPDELKDLRERVRELQRELNRLRDFELSNAARDSTT